MDVKYGPFSVETQLIDAYLNDQTCVVNFLFVGKSWNIGVTDNALSNM